MTKAYIQPKKKNTRRELRNMPSEVKNYYILEEAAAAVGLFSWNHPQIKEIYALHIPSSCFYYLNHVLIDVLLYLVGHMLYVHH